MAKNIRPSISAKEDIKKFNEIAQYFGLENNSDVFKLLINTIHAELEDTKSKYIKAKLEGLKPSAITKERKINYNQVKKLSEQYKDV